MSSSWVAVTSVLPPAPELADEVDQHPLRARVERRGRLVEQQHVRAERQHRRDRRALLLAARQLERRAVGEVGDVHLAQRLVAAGPDLVLRQAELERAEGDVVEDRRAEQLDVGVLEDEPDLAVEAERVLRRRRPRRRRGRAPASCPRSGAMIPSRSLSSVDLPEPLAPEQRDPLAALDAQVDPVERDLPAAVQVADAVELEDGSRSARRRRLDRQRQSRLGRHGRARPTRRRRRRRDGRRRAPASRPAACGRRWKLRIAPVKPRATIAA